MAAGRGERLRPLTDHTPKPLIELGNHCLIEHHLVNLAATGFNRVIVNLSWLGEKIRYRLGDGSQFGLEIIFSDESSTPLETAGGIVHGLALIQSSEFVVINGDIFTDYNFGRLNIPDSSQGHLVMVDNPPHHPDGDFSIDENFQLFAGGQRQLTYSGVACFRRSVFSSLQAGRRPLRPILDQHLSENGLSAEHFSGIWFDIGSPERLQIARDICQT